MRKPLTLARRRTRGSDGWKYWWFFHLSKTAIFIIFVLGSPPLTILPLSRPPFSNHTTPATTTLLTLSPLFARHSVRMCGVWACVHARVAS
ncbi:hypothetical protein CLOP_g14457 [Closterium sp. NIES-67]|nr:hypothetical protein CLOP_g18365 [Closterium sp. NIES-67]GJP73691.1 hypothetical protein CLOP_g4380 [Closterium sp. NIES-67]GJP84399.1 hypothetical protein CLOP_g14457 [Closterium sp. NIES-67]